MKFESDIEPAVDWMDVPRRGVEESEVRYRDLIRVHEFHKIPASVLELLALELRPPRGTLPVNCSVVP